MSNFNVIKDDKTPGFVKAWTNGVPVAKNAKEQLLRTANMPFIHKWVAAMPDVHVGLGATIGSVVATNKAIIPAAVGVDIGCGMRAERLNLYDVELPDNLSAIRVAIEEAVPHGRTDNGGVNDKGRNSMSRDIDNIVDIYELTGLHEQWELLANKYPNINRAATPIEHLGTLGTGNHFIELCLDETGQVWVMLHSGSRGVGNRIGQHFINLAKEDMRKWFVNLPDKDLAYFPEGTEHFDAYIEAVSWAQRYANLNREVMMKRVLDAIHNNLSFSHITCGSTIDCHHNYVEMENHFGCNVWVTRKGAVRARTGDIGIIPGSMGTKSYIVRGLGNPDSFNSCSHGAGRIMSRIEARNTFTVDDHRKSTVGVECRKDVDILDETPDAYKNIDAVMAAQSDLVEVAHTLKQIVCIKG